jgi:tRNA pseudouridine38-40 synthase
MTNIKLILSYDGTNYSGWQFQPDVPTLQGKLESAIRKISGEELRVIASGRTDAGVHAYGQVVSFHTKKDILPYKWMGGLNHFLPKDIRVIEASVEDDEFSAWHSSRGKVYQYILLRIAPHAPLMRNRAWQVGYKLDIDAMRAAAESLLGEHDFSSFRAIDCSAKNPIRTLRRLEIVDEPDMWGTRITFTLEANAFLRHMVRNIVGTLVWVGRGLFKADDISHILAAKDRTHAGLNAPPQGLYMVKVYY